MIKKIFKFNINLFLFAIIYCFNISKCWAIGAGIFPYFIDNNSLYFYLLKSQNLNVWHDFGGSFDSREIDLYYSCKIDQAFIQAAARHFDQKTNGIFKSVNGFYLNYQNIINLLSQKNNSGIFYAERRFNKYVYRLFFVPVLPDPDILSNFFVQYMKKNRGTNKQNLSNNGKFAIAIISLDDFINTIENFYSIVKITKISYNIGQGSDPYFVNLKKSFIELIQDSSLIISG